ncbi:MAG: helix-turn-helix domain-containing protein [Actinomycetota bacterium]|nr:helix-turn-helix domain-containing protein [Actinomycetota bacterium]
MRRTSFENAKSSLARSLEIVGDWWTLLIVRDAFMGIRRFDDFQEHLGIARNILAARIRRLMDFGILERKLYQVKPKRYEYVLTESGKDLKIILLAIKQWGDKNIYEGKGHPVSISHKDCGEEISVDIVCRLCMEVLSDDNERLDWSPGDEMSDNDRRVYSRFNTNSTFEMNLG